jgi:hypothetical protein
MQVVCANCQLSFQAPDGAAGLMCPICRSPLKPPESAGNTAAPAPQIVEWSGGTIDDLIALMSGPAWSARIEVFPTGAEQPVGEIHVIAGGVSDALFKGASTHDALDDLRAATTAGGRFRIEPRLPSPGDGSLAAPGPSQGKLEERPLATLMRYCEDFVLTCGIEVWRGSENAKVDYRRGEIVGVTVGGIDAPERLAEVMKWASGNYRFTVPLLSLPARPPAPAAPVPAAAKGAAPPAPRTTGSAANSRTIFGMQAVDPAAMPPASRPKAPTPIPGLTAAAPVASATATPSAGVAATSSAAAAKAPPLDGGRSATGPAALAAAATGASAATGPVATATATTSAAPAPLAASAAAAPGATPTLPVSTAAPSVPGATPPGRAGANRTIFGMAAPTIPVPSTEAPAAAGADARGAESGPTATEAAGPGKPGTGKPAGAGKAGKAGARVPAAAGAPSGTASEEDRTSPTRGASKDKPGATGETAVWTYVGVGFVFGLALLGVYRLVMVFAN